MGVGRLDRGMNLHGIQNDRLFDPGPGQHDPNDVTVFIFLVRNGAILKANKRIRRRNLCGDLQEVRHESRMPETRIWLGRLIMVKIRDHAIANSIKSPESGIIQPAYLIDARFVRSAACLRNLIGL